MPDQASINELTNALQELLKFKDEELIRRPDWGRVNFENARQDIETILSICNDLDTLPTENLTTSQADQIRNQIESCSRALKAVAEFSVDEGGYVPANRRDELATQVAAAAQELVHTAAPQIPYLAYRRGDVADNIATLQNSVDLAQRLLNGATASVDDSKAEIGKIVAAAREAAASAGVATFTQEFDGESAKLTRRSTIWLLVTAALAIATLAQIFMPMTWFSLIETDTPSFMIAQTMFTKAASIAVLLTSTIWAGRIYRALIHQASVNRHRALSLKTFQAFTEATDNQQTRDAVLTEATRAIFGSTTTGLVDHDLTQPVPGNIVALGNLPKAETFKGGSG